MTGDAASDLQAAASVAFAPVLAWRRGTVPFAALRELTAAHTGELVTAILDARRHRATLLAEVLDALHAAVPTAEQVDRRQLLRISRALFNDRAPAAGSVPAARAHLTGSPLAALESWLACRAREDALLTRARDTLAAELDEGRGRLAELTQTGDFRSGVQLCDQALYQKMDRYAASVSRSGRLSAELRRVERTLVSLAYRSALKPTPFAAFTAVGLWHDLLDTPEGANRRRVRSTRLNRRLLDWMVAALSHDGELADLLEVRLNNTVAVRGGRIEFFVPPPEGASGDPFRTLPVDEVATRVIAALADGPVAQRRLLDRLDGDAASVRAAVDRLVAGGACERSCDVPDQDPDFAGVVGQRLSVVPALASIFRRLAEAERRFGTATTRRREALLDSVRGGVAEFRERYGLDGPPSDAVRTLVFEDLGDSGGPSRWSAGALDDHRAEFALLHRFLPLLDDATLVRLGMYRLFTLMFGEHGECADVLEFYRAFSGLSPNEQEAISSGWGDPAVAVVHRLRHRVAVRLREELDADTLRLDPAWLEGFCAEYPPFVRPWASATHKLQLLDTPGFGLVVNEIRSGWGTFYARVCELGEPHQAEAVRELVERGQPRQADLIAVLGHNFNLHPRLAPLSVEYPGSRCDPRENALTLRELGVRADPLTRCLFLVSRRDGAPVTLMPLNPLHPAAAPDLYRFLHAFAPTASYRGQVWSHHIMTARGQTDQVVRLPRVVVGGVVLERRTWRLPVAGVRAALDTADDLDLVIAARRWQTAGGLPERSFFRLIGGDPLTARGRKPHYLDVRNPFLLQALRGSMRAAADATHVVLQECLPDVDAYRDGAVTESAEEIAIEVNLR